MFDPPCAFSGERSFLFSCSGSVGRLVFSLLVVWCARGTCAVGVGVGCVCSVCWGFVVVGVVGVVGYGAGV